MRVGGRFSKSEWKDLHHPYVLPNESVVSKRIIDHFHQKVQHEGRTTTIAAVRSAGFWIIGINGIVRKLIFQCFRCRWLRGTFCDQKMAHLPNSRLTTEGLFTSCGVDMFGPFTVKDRRKEMKRYVALFTCLSSRAIHLEPTKEMTTDSFINALRRFLCRRGPVRTIFCDNGSNFVGSQKELQQNLKEMEHDRIKDMLLQDNCDWVSWEFNPPHASHLGGVWERMIRSVRMIMTNLLRSCHRALDDEMLNTFLCEAELLVNSTPISSTSIDNSDVDPISPINLLTGKSKLVLSPPGVFQNADIYCRKRWRVVQHLTDQFWRKWKKEYAITLQTRAKWQKERRNIAVGDIVLVKEEELQPRNRWPVARVMETFPDPTDNLVRSVKIRMAGNGQEYLRPIRKMVLLLPTEV